MVARSANALSCQHSSFPLPSSLPASSSVPISSPPRVVPPPPRLSPGLLLHNNDRGVHVDFLPAAHAAIGHSIARLVSNIQGSAIEGAISAAKATCSVLAEFSEVQYAQSSAPLQIISSITKVIAHKVKVGVLLNAYPTDSAAQQLHNTFAHCDALYDLTPWSLQVLANDISRGKLSHVVAIVETRQQLLRAFEYLLKQQVNCSITWIKWQIDALYIAESVLFTGLIADIIGHRWTHSVECIAASAYHVLQQSKLPLRIISVALHTKKLKDSSTPDLMCYYPERSLPFASSLLLVHGDADLAPGLVKICHEWKLARAIKHFH